MNYPARGGRRTIPTELAAMASGVPEATIRKWASRGKLTRYGSARKAEYDIEELTALMAGKIPSVGGARRGGSPSGAADPTAL